MIETLPSNTRLLRSVWPLKCIYLRGMKASFFNWFRLPFKTTNSRQHWLIREFITLYTNPARQFACSKAVPLSPSGSLLPRFDFDRQEIALNAITRAAETERGWENRKEERGKEPRVGGLLSWRLNWFSTRGIFNKATLKGKAWRRRREDTDTLDTQQSKAKDEDKPMRTYERGVRVNLMGAKPEMSERCVYPTKRQHPIDHQH